MLSNCCQVVVLLLLLRSINTNCQTLSCQSILLMSDVYTCYWSIFPIDKLIIYQDAREKRFLLYDLENALIRSLFLLLSFLLIDLNT